MQSLQSQIGWYKRAQTTVGIIAAAGLLAFYLAAYRPMGHRQAELARSLAASQQELISRQARLRDLPGVGRQLQDMESLVRMYDRQFPHQPEIAPFIRDLSRIGQQLGLQQWKYEHGVPRRTDAFYELPIQMTFRGDFLNVSSFLRQMEDLQRLTRVKRLSMKVQPNTTSGMVDVQMAVNIYFAEE